MPSTKPKGGAGLKVAAIREIFYKRDSADYAKVTDLQDGEMKEVEVEGLKILLTRLDGTFYAIQNGQVMAAAGCEYDHGMAYIAELMRNGLMPTPAQLRSGAADLLGHLK